MELTEYPKWIRKPGHPDVLVNTVDEERAQIAAWDGHVAEPRPNALLAPVAAVSATPPVNSPPVAPATEPERRISPPAEPRAEQLAVAIPDDWRELPYIPRKAGEPSLKSLASRVSDAPIVSKAVAIAAIEAEIEKRAK